MRKGLCSYGATRRRAATRMRSSVAGSKGSTQWKRALRPSARAAARRARWTNRFVPDGPISFGVGSNGTRGGAGRLTGCPGSLLRRRGGGGLRLRDAVTLVPMTVGRGPLRHGQVLRLRRGGRDLGAVRRLLAGGIRGLGRGGSGGRRRGRRLGGEHRGG